MISFGYHADKIVVALLIIVVAVYAIGVEAVAGEAAVFNGDKVYDAHIRRIGIFFKPVSFNDLQVLWLVKRSFAGGKPTGGPAKLGIKPFYLQFFENRCKCCHCVLGYHKLLFVSCKANDVPDFVLAD